jgi:uncharacterized protein (DUF1330 family)
MSKVYAVAELKIINAEGYSVYTDSFLEVLSKFDGKLIGFAEPPESLEGEIDFTRSVLLEFSSREELGRWYKSDEYQAILPHRLANSEGSVVVIPDITGAA